MRLEADGVDRLLPGSQTKESCRRPWRFNLRKAVGSAQTVRQREALLDRAECYCQILAGNAPESNFLDGHQSSKILDGLIIRDYARSYNAARIFFVLAVAEPALVPAAGPLGEVVAVSRGFSTKESPRPLLCLILPELSLQVAACSVCARLSS